MGNQRIGSQGLLYDLHSLGRYVKRKINEKRKGQDYVFTQEDFNDFSRMIHLWNWMTDRLKYNKIYRLLIDEGFFGPRRRPKVHSRVVPLNAKIKSAPGSVVPTANG